jgi:hypothetical protein
MMMMMKDTPSSYLSSNFNERKTTMEAEMKLQVKKEWKTPELIVLVRSKPEEAVLAACKLIATGSGHTGDAYGCSFKIGGTGSCSYTCSSTSGT